MSVCVASASQACLSWITLVPYALCRMRANVIVVEVEKFFGNFVFVCVCTEQSEKWMRSTMLVGWLFWCWRVQAMVWDIVASNFTINVFILNLKTWNLRFQCNLIVDIFMYIRKSLYTVDFVTVPRRLNYMSTSSQCIIYILMSKQTGQSHVHRLINYIFGFSDFCFVSKVKTEIAKDKEKTHLWIARLEVIKHQKHPANWQEQQ